MPGKVKVRIIAGRNLPVMDKSSDTSDAFVEVKLGNTTYKTEVYRHSLNPCWNSDCFRFEVDDEELQDEPLQIRIMDYDTYSANDAIGKVYIDLNPLLHKDSVHAMWGWFPIYDTMHGIRGEVHCAVKVDLFSDSNRYRQSSCGVRFFYSPGVPHGYACQAILGFVEELVVNDDPEYQWIDKIRTPRASNEARQTLFSKLSGEVKRKIGLKALELGGNSVVGYQQYFDLEGESGIVVRGIGTAVILTKLESSSRHHHGKHNHGITTQLTSLSHNQATQLAEDTKCESLFSYHSALPTKQQDSSHPQLTCCSDQSYDQFLKLSTSTIPVAFLSDIDIPFPNSSFPRASSPSSLPSRSSSPVYIFSSSPRLCNWFGKLTRVTSTKGSIKKNPSNTTTNNQGSVKLKLIGSSKDAETSHGVKNYSNEDGGGGRNCSTRPTLKRVASQPATNAGYQLNQLQAPCLSNLSAFSSERNFTFKPVRSLSSHPIELPDDVNSITSTIDRLTSSSSCSASHPFSISRLTPTTTTTNVINAMAHGNNNLPNPQISGKDGILPSSSPSNTTDACNIITNQSSSSAATTGASGHNNTTNGHPVSPHGANIPSSNKFLCGSSPSKMMAIGLHRRGSSDPDLSSTPRASSSHSSTCGSVGKTNIKFMISPENLHLLEYPFITMKQFPAGFIAHIGGTVSSRSVKLLDHINCPEDPETRDAWWMELRKEIRSHCRSLTCNAVCGYSEATYICDNVVILSASGTAVVLSRGTEHEVNTWSTPVAGREKEKGDTEPITTNGIAATPLNKGELPLNKHRSHPSAEYQHSPNCSICHIPYPESSVPFHSSLLNCSICKKAKVSDVLFMTIEPPSNMAIVGRGCLIQARVCRNKRDSKGEQCAKEISDSLPFLEHELHRQLLSKVKVKGMNSIFGLTVQISFGENMLIALATGTAAYIGALPPPNAPQISSGKGVKSTDLNAIQKLILESMSRNREHYGLNHIPQEEPEPPEASEKTGVNNTSESESEQDCVENYMKKAKDPGLDSILGNKEGCVVLEVDDTEDADIISLMIDSDVPKGYEICNTESMPGLTNRFSGVLQTFAQVHRVKLIAIKQFGQQFDWIIQGLFVKLRRLVPCCLTDLKFRVDLPEPDLVQVTVLGSAIGMVGSSPHCSLGKGGLHHPSASTNRRRRTLSANDSCDDLLFTMDDDQNSGPDDSADDVKREHFHPSESLSELNGIELTPLSYVPGSHIQKYLGNLDFFFIRETTSIRESGGLNGFIHSFLSEVFAIVRAHVAGLSGNAMVSLHLTQCVLVHNPHKNQAQCLINIAGDAVSIQACPTKAIVMEKC